VSSSRQAVSNYRKLQGSKLAGKQGHNQVINSVRVGKLFNNAAVSDFAHTAAEGTYEYSIVVATTVAFPSTIA